jgi:hypothetical protein
MNEELTGLDTVARKVLEAASGEALRLNHTYIGTEHLLLALLHEPASGAASALAALNIGVNAVETQVESLITRGPAVDHALSLPMTPRMRRVMDLAWEEATMLQQPRLSAGHLLMGLLREPDGVAGKVLAELGVSVTELRGRLLQVRLEQIKIVERCVRPVTAATARKRKMRDELLAHLSTIYQQELTATGDAEMALNQARQRFGDPTDLARQLQDALPSVERFAYRMERIFGWRAPESAARYVLRQSMLSFLVVACVCALAVAVHTTVNGVSDMQLKSFRLAGGLMVLVPLDQFLLGILYFKMRDLMWGAFGTRRSLRRATLCAALTSVTVFGSGMAFLLIATADLKQAVSLSAAFAAGAILVAVGAFLQAQRHGRIQIADTLWECLDLRN